MESRAKLKERVVLNCVLTVKSQLHIGAGKEAITPGTTDLVVIRDSNDMVYIPGSSIRGCLRMEAEKLSDEETIEKIFGRADKESLASKIIVRNGYLKEEEVIGLDTRPGIQIDRETGSVKKGALFFTEAIPRGTKFYFQIIVDNPTDEELQLILAAIRAVNDRGLGHGVSRGFGHVVIKIKDDSVIKTPTSYITGETESFIEKYKKLNLDDLIIKASD